MPASYKIFLSSTKKDLEKERRSLIELLKKADYEVCCMEWFGAFPKHPKDEVEDYVNQCPVYIILIGESYGSIPEVDGVLLDKSFTEFEYDAACKKKDMIILCFKKEIEHNDERLKKFAERLGKSHGVALFKNADDLPGIVLASLRRELNKPEYKKLFQDEIMPVQQQAGQKAQLSTDLKYFCNRYNQADAFDNSFYILNYQSPIHLFLLPGQKDDSHTSFVNRYACQFKYEGKQIVEVTVITKYFPLQSEVQLLLRIKNEIRTQLIEALTLPVRQITAADIFDALTKAKKDFLIINLVIESSYLKDNNVLIYKKAIQNFYNEIASLKNPVDEKKILTFLLFRQTETEDNKQLSSQITDDDSFLKNNKLPRLEKICISDIEDWLLTRKVEKNEENICSTLEKYFPAYYNDPEKRFSMSKAEIVLDQIIFEKSKNL
ncbi:MAG: DUF4062 domain-containing protein [Chitinophagaceae bacterium]|nr:DUF4062 domain-containing protein [Chitinophagaceae bacterium]